MIIHSVLLFQCEEVDMLSIFR